MDWLYALLLEGNAFASGMLCKFGACIICVGTGVFLLEKSFAKALSLDCETCNAELLTCLDGSQLRTQQESLHAERVMESFGSMSCVCKVGLGCIVWKLLLRNFVLAAAAC